MNKVLIGSIFIISLLIFGCTQATPANGGNTVIEKQASGADGAKPSTGEITEFYYKTTDGRSVFCIDATGMGYGAGSGLSCDWGNAKNKSG